MTKEKNVAASEPQELKRGIKGWQVAFIGLGGVIGSCYFLGVGWCHSGNGSFSILRVYSSRCNSIRSYDFLRRAACKSAAKGDFRSLHQ